MKLILHSDDFGLHREINRAILSVAAKGMLTSTSLLVNGPAAGDAVEQVKAYPLLGVGLHLNIVRGRPLSHPDEIPSLVDKNGLFFNSAGKLLLKSLLGRISHNDVYLEYRRQLLYMMDRKITPTHFDGEKHTHLLLPEAVRALKRLMDEYKIKKVRTINESPVNKTLISSGIAIKGNIQQRLKLMFLEYRTKKACQFWTNFKTPGFFFGVSVSGHIHYPESVRMAVKLLELKLKGTLEWMLHLGYPADLSSRDFKRNLGNFFLSNTRTEELKLLLSREFAEKLEQNRDNLISYREL